MGASVIQEYYKVQEMWQGIDADKKWKLALWVLEYQDVDIVDKFMGIEASPLGRFRDVFFHFESEYRGDNRAFEAALYHEYLSWFDTPHENDMDILSALKNDGLFKSGYQPDRQLKPSIENLWKEMLRLKSCIRGLESCHFCMYFQLPHTDGGELTGWYRDILGRGVPEGIRLTAIDYAGGRKVKLHASDDIVILKPELNMRDAINNEMDKGSYNGNTVGTEGRYRKQIRLVLECSQSPDKTRLDKEIKKLLEISAETGNASAFAGTCMIASLAYFYARNDEKCERYADTAIEESEKRMDSDTPEPDSYSTWKGAVLLKAAILTMNKQRREAISLYEKLALRAMERQDAFYVMEGYRLAGHLYYELSDSKNAFEHSLLAVAAGDYLEKEVRRQSTFLQAANLALHLGETSLGQSDVEVIEEQLKDLLGDDWKALVRNENMDKSQLRRKASVFKR